VFDLDGYLIMGESAMIKKPFLFLLIFIAALMVSGCRSLSDEISDGQVQMTIQITSSAFSEGGTIPQKYTCDGVNVSPPLSWTGLPNGTKSLAMIADDPDAPVGTWVHWVLYDIPSDLSQLAEGAQGIGTPGINDFRKTGYGGPCPPKGKPHRYYFKLYALDTALNLKPGASKENVLTAMKGHVLANGELMGRYGR
jgi:Raf kinase inhibitor-like YbhB/YbcL family protein